MTVAGERIDGSGPVARPLTRAALRPLRVLMLVVLWVLLWGRLSVANVASGLLVAVAVTLVFPNTAIEHARFPVRPLANVRLLMAIAWQLVISNFALVRDVVTPVSRQRTGVVVCRLRTGDGWSAALVANILSLSPGTMPVRVESEPAEIHVHVLHLDDPADIRRAVTRLESLVLRAYGRGDELAGLDRVRTDAEQSG